jgi:hypothetical protein
MRVGGGIVQLGCSLMILVMRSVVMASRHLRAHYIPGLTHARGGPIWPKRLLRVSTARESLTAVVATTLQDAGSAFTSADPALSRLNVSD